MENFDIIKSCVIFVETRIKQELLYTEMEKAVGFSYRTIREKFSKLTGSSLSKYISTRRVANAAFDTVHGCENLTEIAYRYGFNSYDSFARAFKRGTGFSPKDFRKNSIKVGRRLISAGLFAPFIYLDDEISRLQPQICEDKMQKTIEKTDKSCVLYGVPKVEYSMEECTPFLISLKACLNYLGQEIDYSHIMNVSGAAYRLRWNIDEWDQGNVDIQLTYSDRMEVFRKTFEGAGRKWRSLAREDSSKEGFIEFIKAEIDQGRPVIALGIIGPPEACLVTGYRDDGQTLLGWNCFQENLEFARNTQIDESGYFISSEWWENPWTLMLMAVEEEQENLLEPKAILENGIELLSKEVIQQTDVLGNRKRYAGGQNAYQLWEQKILDEAEFADNLLMPAQFDRLVCQNDAQAMVAEGRSYAAVWLDWLGGEQSEIKEQCARAAREFKAAAQCVASMNEFKGGYMQDENSLKLFMQQENRVKIAALVRKASQHEKAALALLREIIEML